MGIVRLSWGTRESRPFFKVKSNAVGDLCKWLFIFCGNFISFRNKRDQTPRRVNSISSGWELFKENNSSS